jgi:hypothetical protein
VIPRRLIKTIGLVAMTGRQKNGALGVRRAPAREHRPKSCASPTRKIKKTARGQQSFPLSALPQKLGSSKVQQKALDVQLQQKAA